MLSLFGGLTHTFPNPGLRRYGVPPGGPFDVGSARRAGGIVGGGDSPLELAFGTVRLFVLEAGTLGIAGVGRLERVPALTGRTLEFAPERGARLYLAAPGGWTPPVPGADPEAALRLVPGDEISAPSHARKTPARFVAPVREGGVLRTIAGPQRRLWAGELPQIVATSGSDRRGVRFSGATSHRHEVPSEPCALGAFQWTPAGELILLGPDGPVVGGYPKPFVLVAEDLPLVAQARPGDRFGLLEVERSFQELWAPPSVIS